MWPAASVPEIASLPFFNLSMNGTLHRVLIFPMNGTLHRLLIFPMNGTLPAQ
jgi:hypothetical protein